MFLIILLLLVVIILIAILARKRSVKQSNTSDTQNRHETPFDVRTNDIQDLVKPKEVLDSSSNTQESFLKEQKKSIGLVGELMPNALLQGGKYRIEKSLGQGGFGITYLAEQTNLNRKVCIKEFFMKEYGERTESSNADSEATVLTGVSAVTSAAAEIMGKYRDKFIKEAKTIAKLDHPGIVRIHDVFEDNGTAYYVMDFIEGENLNDLVKREGALSEERALGYIHQVADALSYVHAHNIMHLDVKPSNIILRKSDDRAILIDFGAAKQYDSSGTQTSTTPVGLSAGFAPIELMKIGGVQTFSPETDVYSLGATLYYLVTGQNPPDASDVLDEGLPEMPEKLSSSLRAAVIESMKTKKLRPKSISAFLELLDS